MLTLCVELGRKQSVAKFLREKQRALRKTLDGILFTVWKRPMDYAEILKVRMRTSRFRLCWKQLEYCHWQYPCLRVTFVAAQGCGVPEECAVQQHRPRTRLDGRVHQGASACALYRCGGMRARV